MAKMTALRQLSGDYGSVKPGDVVEIQDEKVAEDLEARGLFARGSKKVTDSVVEKAAEKAAETNQAGTNEAVKKAQENAPPSGATQLDPNAVKQAEKAKSTGPTQNK